MHACRQVEPALCASVGELHTAVPARADLHAAAARAKEPRGNQRPSQVMSSMLITAPTILDEGIQVSTPLKSVAEP